MPPIAEFDRKKAANDEAEGRLARARRALDLARNQLDYAELKADADGVITATLAEPGQVVAIGQPVARLAHRGEKEAVVALPETWLAEARQAKATVRLWSDGDRSFAAQSARALAAGRSRNPHLCGAVHHPRRRRRRRVRHDRDGDAANAPTMRRWPSCRCRAVLNRGSRPVGLRGRRDRRAGAAAGDGRRLHRGCGAGHRPASTTATGSSRSACRSSKPASGSAPSKPAITQRIAGSGVMKRFNLSEWAITHQALVLFMILLIGAAGLFSYFKLGRAEDPSFTIKVMNIQVAWPGATAAEMQTQVVDKIEKKLQELPYLDRVDELFAARRRLHPGQSLRHDAAAQGQGPLVPGAQEGRRHPRRSARRHHRPELQRRVRRRLFGALHAHAPTA